MPAFRTRHPERAGNPVSASRPENRRHGEAETGDGDIRTNFERSELDDFVSFGGKA